MIQRVETGTSSDTERSARLGDPALRRALCRSLEARVPKSEIDDLVQATLVEALAAAHAPADAVELRRWVYGILRNKVADHYRKGKRETFLEGDPDDAVAESAPTSARELLRWAEKELPSGDGAERTLEWMLEEADGEKLEDIARAERVPAARVRQRVARLRRHFRERWAAKVVAAVGALVLALVAVLLWKKPWNEPHEVVIVPEPSARPDDRAVELRRVALGQCERHEYAPCLEGLDAAKKLDPSGDATEVVRRARAAASAALVEPPTLAPSGNPPQNPAPTGSSLLAPPPVPAPHSTATPPRGSSAPTARPRHKVTSDLSSSEPSSGSVK
jgi:DNA-directed RNA polymerase specialized sigma24 family protein